MRFVGCESVVWRWLRCSGSRLRCTDWGGDVMATTTRERPIIFSAPMVRAILDGRKTQTRRIVDRVAGCIHPDRFAYHERREQEWRDKTGHDFAILRDSRGGETRPYTLRQLRADIDAGRSVPDNWRSLCACFNPDGMTQTVFDFLNEVDDERVDH